MSGYEYTKISWFFVFSETNERVNFWNILFDVNQKQLDEKFLLTDSVNCTIETTDAAIKNQTASSSYKPALLDCGIKINVPPFIESGEKIIIDTRTLEYVKRANWWD